MAASENKKIAIVTGSNKGIGYEICRQLGKKGVSVVVTARDQKRGIEAFEKLRNSFDASSATNFFFHRLDVADPNSVASLADFVKNRFGSLDILVNNAGIAGVTYDIVAAGSDGGVVADDGAKMKMMQTYDLAKGCIQTNYYGAKQMTETFIPLLTLSTSPTIVNVSSIMGKLQRLKNERAKEIFNDFENLTEEGIDQVLTTFLEDLRADDLASRNWPTEFSAYIVSKAAMNSYTRVAARRYRGVCVNCVCPGFVKTDINNNAGKLSVEEGAESVVSLALMMNGGGSGLFFDRKEVSSFE